MNGRLEEELARKWISLAYGEDEAIQAMGLPAEVRSSLYPNLMLFGPAGVQVEALFERVTSAVKQDDMNRVEYVHVLSFSFQFGEFASHLKAFQQWLNQGEVATHLVPTFWRCAPLLRNSQGMNTAEKLRIGMVFFAIIVTAQYLASEEVQKELAPYMRQARNAMKSLGI